MDLKDKAKKLLHSNRRMEDGNLYTVPSPSTYPHQWLWDSCFHAIVLAKLEPEAAKSELRSLFVRQLPNGMIPHMIFWKWTVWPPYTFFWGKKGTSSITQPPMVAYATLEVYKYSKDKAFLEEIYPKLFAYYQYLIDERDTKQHHLIGIINPDESGEDNSPRFDKPMGAPIDVTLYGHILRRQKLLFQNKACNFDAELCMSENFWVKDVPFNSIIVKNLESLAEIATILEHEDGKRFATLQKDLIGGAMRERLFYDGVFWSSMGHDYERLRVSTWAHFAPLFANLYTAEEAKDLINTHFYDNGTFRAPFGIRTTSKQERSYRPNGFWRGPIWFAPHWFIYKGLINYGFQKEADWIRERSLELIEKNGFREYFNPETGEGYGARDFTWGTLVLDMDG